MHLKHYMTLIARLVLDILVLIHYDPNFYVIDSQIIS